MQAVPLATIYDMTGKSRLTCRLLKNVVNVGKQLVDVLARDAEASLPILVQVASVPRHRSVRVSFGHNSSLASKTFEEPFRRGSREWQEL